MRRKLSILWMLAPRKLILASGSPRRQQLLRDAGIEFEAYAPDISEEQRPGEQATDYALRLAREKAEKVAKQFPQHVVLAADTIVVVDGRSLGKPNDEQDAERMLHLLSGRSHQVTTAVSVVVPGKPAQTRSRTTDVHFRDVTAREIKEYIATAEPMDKAGAYAIQGGAAPWVVRVEGEYSNVVGLPLSLVTEMLHTCGFLQS
ncbi:MAG TPA: nucleoside triphosphate pyrophosphatase [Candidatus Acidoferrum sp.]|nr:nucleoside triphosphate pyrophosphatase [Candidatus Acidoferrum sp.]